MEPIKFIIGEETGPVIENWENKNNSLFSELYDKTFDCINQYLQETENLRYDDPCNEDYSQKRSINRVEYEKEINNIFAFVGERGSGKTSCMLSVANMLRSMNNSDDSSKNDSKKNNGLPFSTQFAFLDIVDPSFIDEKSNILQLTVATMFKNFKERISSEPSCITYKDNDCDLDLKHRLLDLFQKVFEDIKWKMNDKAIDPNADSVEELVKMACGVDLKQHLYCLIRLYLQFMKDGNVLVIPVDDIDLNIRYAYNMVEQIRKYLILPNVLILMSVKLDQLESVLNNDFYKQFKSLPADNINNLIDIQTMSDRYIQKLIPLSHRFYLPDLEAEMDRTLLIYDSRAKEQEDKENDHSKQENWKIRNRVLSLIFEKTRFLFYNTKGITNFIIPRNLRELKTLITLLWKMPEYNGDEYGKSYNKTLFLKYFYETWCDNNLSNNDNNLFQEILSVTDAVNINATVLYIINKRFNDYLREEISSATNSNFSLALRAKELKSIFDKRNNNYNFSLGDVIGVLNICEKTNPKIEDQKFIFAVKTYYSIKLYEYYDELTANPNFSLISDEEQKGNTELNQAIFKHDFLYQYSNYAKLVGGNFINSNLNYLIPFSTYYSQYTSRGQRVINGDVLKKIIGEITSQINTNIKELQDITDLKDKIHLVEFFALMISRSEDSKTGYRREDDIYYSKNLEATKTNYWFDIVSCLYNSIDIERCYNRLDPSLFENIQKYDNNVADENKSLYYNITKKYEERNYDNIKHSTYSMCMIRNIEVLDNFVNYLLNQKPDGKKKDIEVIQKFLNNIKNAIIPTYDSNNRTYHQIQFTHIGVLGDFISDVNKNTSLKDYFNKIYNGTEIQIKLTFPKFRNKNPYPAKQVIELFQKKNEGLNEYPFFEEILKKTFTDNKQYTADDIKALKTDLEKEIEKYLSNNE